MDVTNKEEVQAVGKLCTDKFGVVEILINNAGSLFIAFTQFFFSY